MRRNEYLVYQSEKFLNNDDLQKWLNKLDYEGLEIVTVLVAPNIVQQVICKRKLTQEVHFKMPQVAS